MSSVSILTFGLLDYGSRMAAATSGFADCSLDLAKDAFGVSWTCLFVGKGLLRSLLRKLLQQAFLFQLVTQMQYYFHNHARMFSGLIWYIERFCSVFGYLTISLENYTTVGFAKFLELRAISLKIEAAILITI